MLPLIVYANTTKLLTYMITYIYKASTNEYIIWYVWYPRT